MRKVHLWLQTAIRVNIDSPTKRFDYFASKMSFLAINLDDSMDESIIIKPFIRLPLRNTKQTQSKLPIDRLIDEFGSGIELHKFFQSGLVPQQLDDGRMPVREAHRFIDLQSDLVPPQGFLEATPPVVAVREGVRGDRHAGMVISKDGPPYEEDLAVGSAGFA